MFYEGDRDRSETYHISRSQGHIYPEHFHQNIELFFIKRGSYKLVNNGATYSLVDGDVFFIDSYDIHSFISGDSNNDDCVLIIPFKYLNRFNKVRNNKRVITPLIHNQELCNKIISIIDEYILSTEDDYIKDTAIQLILSLILEKLSFGEQNNDGDALIVREILFFIQNNFKSNISREVIAVSLGYTQTYVSKVFNKYIKGGLSNYINKVRLNYIDERLRYDKGATITELIFEAGFNSLETYYRTKRKYKKASE